MRAPRNEREAHSALMRTQPTPTEAHEAYLETKRNHHEGCTI